MSNDELERCIMNLQKRTLQLEASVSVLKGSSCQECSCRLCDNSEAPGHVQLCEDCEKEEKEKDND